MKTPTLADFVSLRTSLGLDAAEVAEMLDYDARHFVRVERGERSFLPRHFFALLGRSVYEEKLVGLPALLYKSRREA